MTLRQTAKKMKYVRTKSMKEEFLLVLLLEKLEELKEQPKLSRNECLVKKYSEARE